MFKILSKLFDILIKMLFSFKYRFFFSNFQGFGQNLNILVNILKFLVKDNVVFVQISERFCTHFLKTLVTFSNMLVIISKILFKIWSNFWKDFGLNSHDLVRPPPTQIDLFS